MAVYVNMCMRSFVISGRSLCERQGQRWVMSITHGTDELER